MTIQEDRVSRCAANNPAKAVICCKVAEKPSPYWGARLELIAGCGCFISMHEQCTGLSDELAEPD